ncbi:MAG: hypothetical protein M1816_005104 [Peltula sp. TS41687]|nr:MAG: hypothetical protein M1816_005104 [Peltula sp. TS41687]
MAFQFVRDVTNSVRQLFRRSTVAREPDDNMPRKRDTQKGDIFSPAAGQDLPSRIPRRSNHPAPRTGIDASLQNGPIPTNKFYSNFFLGAQNEPTWTHPYSLQWGKGSFETKSWGMSISHIDADQRAFGPGDPPQFYLNPIGIQSIVLSAFEFGSGTVLSMAKLKAFSAVVNLHRRSGAPADLAIPLVQGMGFVTGIYTDVRPVIESGIRFRSITKVAGPRAGISKYKIVLEDGKMWLIYSWSSKDGELNLQQKSNTRIEATSKFTGIVQVAKTPSGSAGEDVVFDASAGVFAAGVSLSGLTSGKLGNYTFQFEKFGFDTSRQLLMFALPHHVESFDDNTNMARTTVMLQTTTKGIAKAVRADSWTMKEGNLPTEIGFDPWNTENRGQVALSPLAVQLIDQVGAREVTQDFNARTNLDSMYFSGKALSKYATLVYTLSKLAPNPSQAQAGLNKLKAAFAVFSENRQRFPLAYDSSWGGVVSTAAYVTGDSLADFGNTFYNDHHFHYAYFIHAAAIIGSLDPSWLASNRDWVNMLVRDVANPTEQDTYFPVFRSFDWYHGHSWAKGLFPSADGKDEESSSEDAFFAYALKMWGRTSGDASMEARGNLMLAVVARSLRNYFLLESKRANLNHPFRFIPNKVTGILFENKVDHVTYFGAKTEFIQGIHMIPINPSSAYTRSRDFVSEEWKTYFDQGRADSAEGGWKGILYANLAIIDPISSWKFFSQSNFNDAWLDDGASRAWYLAYAAGMAGTQLVLQNLDSLAYAAGIVGNEPLEV